MCIRDSLDGLRRVRAPDDALVQVGDPDAVVLVVELEKERIKALGGVVDRARVSGVEDLALPAARQDDVNIAFGNLTTRRAVPVDAHSAEMHQVDVETALNDCTEHIVRATDVVVDRVALGLRRPLRVGRRTLFGEVDDRVRLLLLYKLQELLVLLSLIHI